MSALNKPPVAIGAVVVLLIGGWLIFNAVAGGKKMSGNVPTQAYFYDLGTGELFAVAADTTPPVDTSAGSGKGVRAHVFSCGDCVDGEMEVAFLQTYTKQAQQARETSEQTYDETNDVAQQGAFQAAAMGAMVAPPPETGQDPQWIPMTSPQARDLTQSYLGMCGRDNQPKPCRPG